MADIESTLNFKNIEANLNEFNNIEKLLPNIFMEENFNRLNYLQSTKTDFTFKTNISIIDNEEKIDFVSVNSSSLAPFARILEKERFLKIVGATKKGISKRSGKYQESLYGYYLCALKENDEGFLSDILNKAVIFENNLNFVKALMRSKSFMKVWRKNFGKESPLHIFKNTGNLRKINMVRERII